ncbi:HAMP domain-containing protein [Synechococcus sp. RSCCF101]|uniref:HAMP domain-containing protein n=1 Tax=Synechococcus sp. RSCCF101 TaxID=2511069 RepID=UPI001245F949|nr:HAMP domain-containing protein [Synechococcus sp. RSCCF101]QEY32512.1 HAMP domain-containing protein [Synechococcus sp. RSCCF101]
MKLAQRLLLLGLMTPLAAIGVGTVLTIQSTSRITREGEAVLSEEFDAQNRLSLVRSYELMQALADFTSGMARHQTRRFEETFDARGFRLERDDSGRTQLLLQGLPLEGEGLSAALEPLLQQVHSFPGVRASFWLLDREPEGFRQVAAIDGTGRAVREAAADAAQRAQLLAVHREDQPDDLDARRIDGTWYVDLATTLPETGAGRGEPDRASGALVISTPEEELARFLELGTRVFPNNELHTFILQETAQEGFVCMSASERDRVFCDDLMTQLDEAGLLIAPRQDGSGGRPLHPDDIQGLSLHFPTGPGGSEETYTSYVVPDADWDWLVAVVVPDRELARIAQPLRQATRRVLIGHLPVFTLLLMAATAGTGWWLARRIRRPLTTLADSTAALARGEVVPELEVPGSEDEIDQLVRGFNQMAAAVGRREDLLRRRIEELQESLDVHVDRAGVDARMDELDASGRLAHLESRARQLRRARSARRPDQQAT